MSGTNTPSTQERDQQLLAIGHQCSSPTCHLVDFLPFKCQHCSQPFCAEHYLPGAHNCDKYDESKYNRVAPSCPLCNDVVSISPGEDPNVRMERHFTTDCTVMTGKPKAKSKPVCANPKCHKVLISPIACTTCKHQFCPQHRFPNQHNCASLSTSLKSHPFSASTPNLSSQTAAARNSTIAAIKRSLASNGSGSSSSPSTSSPSKPQAQPTSIKASSSTPASSSKPGIANPFSKTDSTFPSLVTPATLSSPSAELAPDTTISMIPSDTPSTPSSSRCTPKRPVMDFATSFAPPPLFAAA